MLTNSTSSIVPSPRPMPVIGWRGNALRFFRDPIAYMDPIPKQDGTVVSLARGLREGIFQPGSAGAGVLFAFGPSANQAVLSHPAVFHAIPAPGPKESAAFRRLTSGLFSMQGEQHRSQRRLIMPAFHKGRIESYRNIIAEHTLSMMDGLRAGESVDMHERLRHLTLSIASKIIFGVEITPETLGIAGEIDHVVKGASSPLSMLPLNFPFTPRRRLIERSSRLSDDLSALIAAKRHGSETSLDVLSMLLESRDEDGGQLSDDELVGQAFLLFFAGHDTTTSALSWTLFLLSQHPTILRDLLDELSAEVRGGVPTVEQLHRLPLLGRVIDESLRILPPIPMLIRAAAKPTLLSDRLVPERTEIVLSVYHTQRMPDLYPEPRRFFPDRFLTFKPAPYAYLPLGAGVRTCIGASFALMELKIVLAMLLQRFHFELCHGSIIDRRTAIVMAPRQGMPMRICAKGNAPAAGQPTRPRGDIREMIDLEG